MMVTKGHSLGKSAHSPHKGYDMSAAQPLSPSHETVHMPAKTKGGDVHHDRAFEPLALLRLGIGVIGAMILWFGLLSDQIPPAWIGIGCLMFSGWPIFHEAVENLLIRRMTMELSMSIAIIAAAAISEYFTALVVSLFVLIAEELEHITLSRGRTAIKDLVDFIPPEARVRRNAIIEIIAIEEIVPGDAVLLSPGEKAPVDGRVIAGHSYMDQSRITGESMPAEKSVDSLIYAGSINQMGTLEILVERVGRDTSFGRIIEAVEAAEQTRAPVQKIADQLAGYLVYFSFAAAALTFWLTRDLRDTISVIIVAGACGIAAGTPLAILGGIGRAARLGSIIKGGIHLETLGRIDTVILDKTGTLTFGEPRMCGLSLADGFDADKVLALAASAELHSEHPLARAVIRAAQERNLSIIEPSAFSYQLGRGITATVGPHILRVGNRKLLTEANISVPERQTVSTGSDILVAIDDCFAGHIDVADHVRPEAAAAMQAFADMGVKTILLTGDIETVAQQVAKTLNIADYRADLLPEDKLAYVRALVSQKHAVAMVGDGVNDAPALSAATIGIAMGSGTDIAKESAQVVLIGNDLLKLVETIRIARQTRSIIWQNFVGTLLVDAMGIGMAAFGYLNPLLAAFIHVGSELLFLSNSARLLTLEQITPLTRKNGSAVQQEAQT